MVNFLSFPDGSDLDPIDAMNAEPDSSLSKKL
jgi:hypothetical protein